MGVSALNVERICVYSSGKFSASFGGFYLCFRIGQQAYLLFDYSTCEMQRQSGFQSIAQRHDGGCTKSGFFLSVVKWPSNWVFINLRPLTSVRTHIPKNTAPAP